MNDIDSIFTNQVCIVTGSSRGIGREIALTLARYGANVTVNFLTNTDAARETTGLIADLGREVITVQANVTKPEEADRLIQTTYSQWNRLDLLVNNAGPFVMQTLADSTVDDWQRILDGNLNSAFYCTKPALDIMRKQGNGHIVFIGSIKADSIRARQRVCAYGIAKTGVVLLAKTIAREEGPNGIRANVVNPGIIVHGETPGSIPEDAIAEVPLRRFGKPADIANAVCFLHSPDGAYCNGAVINVDGGLWA